jgi:hypothetical protein
MRALIAAALIVACSLSHAAELPRDIVGVELGATLSLPKCGFSLGRIKTACVETGMNPRQSHDSSAEWLELHLPDVPPGFLDKPWILVIDGQVERVELMTRGIDWQQSVLASLIDKYGEPHELKNASSQNAYGASFDVVEAQWTSEAISVIFDGAFGSIRYGRVWVETPAAKAFDESADAAARAREPRL